MESKTPTNQYRKASRVRSLNPKPRSAIKLYPYQARWFEDEPRQKFANKSRRIGYSFGDGFENVFACLRRPKHTCLVLSRGARQAKEYIDQAVAPHVRGFGVGAVFMNADAVQGSVVSHQVHFTNGSRIIALPATPATARSFEGDVTLDEFAFHRDAREIYQAIAPCAARGFKIRIISTPNGQQDLYYDLARELGLIDGPVQNTKWSVHKTTILDAIAQGCLDINGDPLDAQAVRDTCLDEEMWMQEYMCAFLSTASQWITPEIFESVVDGEANVDLDVLNGYGGQLVAGWDVARNKDLSVVWLLETVGDVTWTRGVLEFKNMSTPNQVREARRLLDSCCYKMVMDKSGMGLAMCEQLEEEYYGRVEGVTFTQQTKEALAVHAKKRMVDRSCRIPDNDMIRNSFRSVKKTVMATGQSRFDAEHDSKYGHADHWWAYCLAESAASLPTCGLFELWKEEAEQIAGKKAPKPAEMSPEQLQNMQVLAQMREAPSEDGINRIFGEQRNVAAAEKIIKLKTVKQTPRCPKCGNPNLGRCAAEGISGDMIEDCATCGWMQRIPRR